MKLIQSVQRAVEILNILSDHQDGISLKDIAEKLNLNSSTVYHLINTLVETGLAKRSSRNNKYKLGFKTLHLGNAYLENLSTHKIALPVLEELLDKFNENIYLTMMEDSNFLPLIKLESSHSVKPTKMSNKRSNAHAIAIGKILLSSFSKEKLYDFMEKYNNLQKFTENTITTMNKFIKELEKVRENGYALDLEESEIGINCIAVPIYNHMGELKASVGTSMPTQRFSEELVNEILPFLKEAAQKISTELGYKK